MNVCVQGCGCNVCDGFGGLVVMCVRDMCDGDCACDMCGKHVSTIMRVCERVCVRGWYGWMM